MGFASTFTGSNFATRSLNPSYEFYPSAPASQFAKRELLRLSRKRNLATRPRHINPTGKSPKTLSSPSDKNIPLNPSGKSVI